MNAFVRRILWLYLNYHRLRVFPGERPGTDEGRGRRRDADIMTPYDRLKSLPGGAACLKPGTTFTQLDAIASATSDNGAAWAVSEAGAQSAAVDRDHGVIPRRGAHADGECRSRRVQRRS